jgi:hypothetical protein
VRGDKSIETHIKFFITDDQWVMDIALNDIWLGLMRKLRPFFDVGNFIEEKDTFSLTFTNLGNKLITGFMIQMVLLFAFLNYSKKIGY